MSYVTYSTKPCPVCKETSYMELWREDVERYRHGAFLQDAFPDLKPEVREMIHTGYHPACWDKVMGSDDDE